MASIFGRSIIVLLTNKSGGGVVLGDVVVVDTTTDESFTTTTSAASTSAIGVAAETIASNAVGRVIVGGYASLVNVNAAVTRNQFGTTHTVAKQAVASASRVAGTFCRWLKTSATPSAYIYPVDLAGAALTDPTTTRGDIIVRGAAALARLALPAAGQGYVSDGTDLVTAEILPWHILYPMMVVTPDATTGTWAIIQFSDAGLLYPFVYSSLTNATAMAFYNSTSAQNDAFSLNTVLAAGTWEINIWVRKSTNTGIITCNMDGVSQGTMDTYAAAAAAAKLSITGISVATSGKKVMQFKAATKNASSSNYLLEIFAIEFRRTA